MTEADGRQRPNSSSKGPVASDSALQRSISLLRATLDATTDGILVVDREGHILTFNQRFQEMWHLPDPVIESRDDERALSFVLDQLTTPEDFLAKVRELYNRPDDESFDVLEFKDGRIFERSSMPQKIDGKSVGRVWSFRDVTQRRQAEEALGRSEEQLRQSRKMEAIGRLAGGVAHDFNNLLTVIKGYCQLLLEDIPADAGSRRKVEQIAKATDSAATLTQQLLAFSRRQVLLPEVISLNDVVGEMEEMLRRLIGEDIDLTSYPAPELGNVKADPSQIEQVIMNLAANARDAMPTGGRLTIETVNVELDDRYAREHVSVKPGNYVMLSVSDNGCGMDEETRQHSFDPFFTTKEKGKGTGLGLSTVYGIVKQSDGNIWVYSEPDRGTTFKIYLPRIDQPVPKREAPHSYEQLPEATETVLLVEDEKMVRDLVRDILLRGGYKILEASNGGDALAISQRFDGRIHLLLTDVVMPQMSGPELATLLASTHQETRVLFMSGYTDDAIVRHGVLEPGRAFIQKPFTGDALARKVREVLEAEKPKAP